MADHAHDDPFPGESPAVRALLSELQAAAAEEDSAAVLGVTAQLLELPLERCADVVHMLRADACFDQQDFAAAAAHYREAIAHGADDVCLAWFQLGNTLAASGQHADAALALSRAAQLEPQHPAVWLQLGYTLLDSQHFTQAELAFGNALKLTDGVKGHYGLAWLYYSRANAASCTQDRMKDTSLGFSELRTAVSLAEVGPELEQLGAVQALLTEAQEPDFPFWHCWVNPAFELARGTDLLKPPVNPAWAELVMWPREADGTYRILRDVLLELPEWGTGERLKA